MKNANISATNDRQLRLNALVQKGWTLENMGEEYGEEWAGKFRFVFVGPDDSCTKGCDPYTDMSYSQADAEDDLLQYAAQIEALS